MKYLKYFTLAHTEKEPMQITRNEVVYLLEDTYTAKAVEHLLDTGYAFRIWTPYREIWTQDEDGMIPTPGFYGVCGEL